jgi:hypothetical protein
MKKDVKKNVAVFEHLFGGSEYGRQFFKFVKKYFDS